LSTRHTASPFRDSGLWTGPGTSLGARPTPCLHPLCIHPTRRPPAPSLAPPAGRGPAERADLLRFNNVASCIRREAPLSIPFPEVPFGEDFAWALRALASGWALHFEPDAGVYHAHSYRPAAALRRYRTDAVFHREFYGAQIRPSLLSAVKGGLYEVKEDLRHLARIGPGAKGFWRALVRSPFLRFAQTYGQYQGSSSERSSGVDAEAWKAARRAGAVGLASSSPEPQVPESRCRLAGGQP